MSTVAIQAEDYGVFPGMGAAEARRAGWNGGRADGLAAGLDVRSSERRRVRCLGIE